MARTKDAPRRGIAQAKINFEVAQMIYDARTKAGLSQSEPAALIGSKQPVIARLEDGGYEGHSLTMLQRIAAALEQRLELRFVPATKAVRDPRAPNQKRQTGRRAPTTRRFESTNPKPGDESELFRQPER
jgi:ribosome-binding protein aMBF1 (putative translation factor)